MTVWLHCTFLCRLIGFMVRFWLAEVRKAQRCHAGPRFHTCQPMPVSAHGHCAWVRHWGSRTKRSATALGETGVHTISTPKNKPSQIRWRREGDGWPPYKALTRQAREPGSRGLRSHEGNGDRIQSDWSAGLLGGKNERRGGGGQRGQKGRAVGETPVEVSPSQALFLKATGSEWKAEAGLKTTTVGSRIKGGLKRRRKPQEGRRKPVFIQVHSSSPCTSFCLWRREAWRQGWASIQEILPSSSIISCNLIHVKSVACEFLSWLVKNLSREKAARRWPLSQDSAGTHLRPGTAEWCMWLRGHHRGSAPAGKEAEPTVVALSPSWVHEGSRHPSYWPAELNQALLLKLSWHEEETHWPFLMQTPGFPLIDAMGQDQRSAYFPEKVRMCTDFRWLSATWSLLQLLLNSATEVKKATDNSCGWGGSDTGQKVRARCWNSWFHRHRHDCFQ